VRSITWFSSTRLRVLSSASALIASPGVEMISCVPVAEV